MPSRSGGSSGGGSSSTSTTTLSIWSASSVGTRSRASRTASSNRARDMVTTRPILGPARGGPWHHGGGQSIGFGDPLPSPYAFGGLRRFDVRASIRPPSSSGLGPVSYTHLTLPTIYSV